MVAPYFRRRPRRRPAGRHHLAERLGPAGEVLLRLGVEVGGDLRGVEGLRGDGRHLGGGEELGAQRHGHHQNHEDHGPDDAGPVRDRCVLCIRCSFKLSDEQRRGVRVSGRAGREEPTGVLAIVAISREKFSIRCAAAVAGRARTGPGAGAADVRRRGARRARRGPAAAGSPARPSPRGRRTGRRCRGR